MTDRKPFLLRLPPDVFDALRRWAEREMRSTNAQVEFVLRQALRNQGYLRKAPARRRPPD